MNEQGRYVPPNGVVSLAWDYVMMHVRRARRHGRVVKGVGHEEAIETGGRGSIVG